MRKLVFGMLGALAFVLPNSLYAEPGGLASEADLGSNRFTVTVLGSGTPLPSQTQAGPAILVEAGEHVLLVDCGRGCTTRLMAYSPNLLTKVDKLLLTHLHSDHVTGIPDLWLNGWTQGRKAPLAIWGPEGTTEMMAALRVAYRRDIDFRVSDGVPAETTGLDAKYIDLQSPEEIVFNHDDLQIIAFIVDHATIKPAYGYRITYRGRSVLISGDTTLNPSLVKYGQGVDLALLEVIPPAMLQIVAKRFGEHNAAKIASYHLTAEQAAQLLLQIKPRLGVFYHTTNDDKMTESTISSVRAIYDGNVIVSSDLQSFSISESSIVPQNR